MSVLVMLILLNSLFPNHITLLYQHSVPSFSLAVVILPLDPPPYPALESVSKDMESSSKDVDMEIVLLVEL